MISEQDFKCLYDKYYSGLFLFAKKIISKDDVCQDIVTDCFIKLWSDVDLEAKSEKGLLFRMVHNKCMDYFKFKCNTAIVSWDKALEYVPDIEVNLIEAEYMSIIYDNLPRIPKRQQQVLQYFIKGLSTPDIAKVLNISTQNVLNSKTYGINRLKQLIHG